MATPADPSPQAVIDRLMAAINAHDLEAFLTCIAPEYGSEQPFHPDRAFHGRAQVRQNWSAVFAGMPDLHWEVLRTAVSGETVWIEVRASGTRVSDGRAIDLGGVVINDVRDDQIVAARIYVEEIHASGSGIDASITQLYAGHPGGNDEGSA